MFTAQARDKSSNPAVTSTGSLSDRSPLAHCRFGDLT
jgi:hypothetical protein